METESPTPDPRWRKRARRALERYFAKRSAPRSILSLLLILTGFAGLVVSFALLRAGLFAMWIRYPIAVLASYGVFIGLLRLWLEFERSRFNPRPGEIEEEASIPAETSASNSYHTRSRDRGWFDFFDLPGAFDADEGCVIALLVGVVIGLISLAVFAILSAQALLAEVFLDAFIVSVLYRRLRIAAEGGWLGTALRRTWLLALLTAALLSLAGWCLEAITPGARSIGPALERFLRDDGQKSRHP